MKTRGPTWKSKNNCGWGRDGGRKGMEGRKEEVLGAWRCTRNIYPDGKLRRGNSRLPSRVRASLHTLDLISWTRTDVAIHTTPNTLHLRPRSWMTARGWRAEEAVFYALSSDNKIIPKRPTVCLHHRAEVWQMEHNIKHCRASRGYQRLPAAAFSTAAPRLKKKRKKNVRGGGERAYVSQGKRSPCAFQQ